MTYSALRLYSFNQYMCSLGIEPTTFALLTQCSTTEPQEQGYFKRHAVTANIFWRGLLYLQLRRGWAFHRSSPGRRRWSAWGIWDILSSRRPSGQTQEPSRQDSLQPQHTHTDSDSRFLLILIAILWRLQANHWPRMWFCTGCCLCWSLCLPLVDWPASGRSSQCWF